MSSPRLTEQEKLDILKAYAGREKLDAIAARFGVDRSYPSKLNKRRGLPPRKRK